MGGVAGVGKTTLLSGIERKYAGKIRLINPGELFRRYYYHNPTMTADEVEELIERQLLDAPDDALAVAHWHYAVRRKRYMPQISFQRLRRLAKSDKIERVMLLLIEAPPDIIIERRRKDVAAKRRPLSRLVIEDEVHWEQKFWLSHMRLFSAALGDDHVEAIRIANCDLEAAKLQLSRLIASLVRPQ
jgi:adenylate kinase